MAATTQSTRNKSKKKVNPIVNDAALDKMIDQKVMLKLEERDAESMFEIPDHISEDLHEDEAQREIDETWSLDIFEDVGGECAARGDTAIYKVVKDNEFLANRRHPYSYEQLQKEFGGGHYRIIARSHATQKYIKQQSRFVAALPVNESEKSREREYDRHEYHQPMYNQAPPNPGPGFMELLTFMKTLTDGQVREAKQIGKEASTVQTQLVTMINESNRSTQDLVMKMQQSNMEMIAKLSDNTTKVFEKMDDKFTKIIGETLKQPKEEKGPDAFTLLKMMQEAEDRGFKKMEMIANMGKAEAEERYELYKEMEGDNGDKGSMLNTIVKAMVPLITQSSNVAQSVAHQQVHRQPTPVQLQQSPARQTLNPPQQRGSLLSNAQSAGASHGQVQVKRPTASQEAKGQQTDRPTYSLNQSLGLASINKTSRVTQKTQSATEKNIEQLFNEANDLQRKMASIAIPKLAECMASNINPRSSAVMINNDLKSNQFSSEQVLENFTFDFVWQIARSFGIDETKKVWFEEFYANFKSAHSVPVGQVAPESPRV